MTVSSSVRKAGPYAGNGISTGYPFAFKVFAAADLSVIRTDSLGNDVELVLGTNYSVTLNADQDVNPGGTVVYPISGTPLQPGSKLTIIGDLAYVQQTDITNQGGFYPQVIENALDYETILIQQLLEQSTRTFRAPASDVNAEYELPTQANRANSVLGFDEDGNPTMYPVGSGVSTPASGVSYGGTTLAALLKDETPHVVASVAALRALSSALYSYVMTAGYYAAYDGGAAIYKYDPLDVSSVDNGGSVIVATDGGRWKFVDGAVWNVRQFGAKGDGVTDDRVPILKAWQAILAAGGGTLRIPEGTYAFPNRISTLLTTAVPIEIVGDGTATILKSTAGAGDIPLGDAHFMWFSTCTAPVTVRGITFDLNNILTTARSTAAVLFTNCTSPRFTHNRVINGRRYAISFAGLSDADISYNYMHRPFPVYPRATISNIVNDGAGGMLVTVSSITNLTAGRRIIVDQVVGTGGLSVNARGLFAVDNPTGSTIKLRSVNTTSVYGAVSSTGSNGGLVRIYVNAACYTATGLYPTDLLRVSYLSDIVPSDQLFAIAARSSEAITISGAANNGSGGVRLTVNVDLPTGAGMLVANTTGTSAYNGYWTVTRIGATEVDLVGSTYSAAMTGNGTTYRIDLAGTSWASYVYPGGGACEYTQPSTFTGAYTSGGRVTVANEYQNQSILALGVGGPYSNNTNCKISNNVMAGWGMMLAGTHYEIANNVVRDYDYGSALVMAAEANTNDCRIIGNRFTGGFGLDINLTQPSGLECWAPRSIVVGNTADNNANAGLQIGGKYSLVEGNICYDNGTYNATGAGLVSAWQDSTINCSYSTFQGNISYDTGAGNQINGYVEYAGKAYVGIRVLDNQCGGTTPYSFSTASTQGTFRGYAYSGSANVGFLGSTATGEAKNAGSVTVTGAQVGDAVEVANTDGAILAAEWSLFGYVISTGLVRVMMQNTKSTSQSYAIGSPVTVTVRQRKP